MFAVFFWSFIAGASSALLLETKREIDHAQEQKAWAAERARLQHEFAKIYMSGREST